MESNDNIYKKQLDRARSLCSRQEKCIWDMQNKFADWDVPDRHRPSILKTLIDEKYIDENRFARSFVREKFHSNKWGKLKIRQALKMKRIPESVISQAMDEISQGEYRDVLYALLTRKKNRIKAKNRFDLMGKLQKYAYGKGFESDLIQSVLNDVVKNPNR